VLPNPGASRIRSSPIEGSEAAVMSLPRPGRPGFAVGFEESGPVRSGTEFAVGCSRAAQSRGVPDSRFPNRRE
jgi:hypothetical protein